MTIYPLSAVRALALHAAHLDKPNITDSAPSFEDIYDLINRLGAVQIDTLQMVARAHYLTIWSRLGSYDIALFDQMGNENEKRKIFEGWFHAACFIPLSEYRYQIPRQRAMRVKGHQWYTEWMSTPGNPDLVKDIFERVRREGAIQASNIEGEKSQHGTWWNWRPEKMALEHLYGFGDLMIAGRTKFRRIYDLAERVLPAWVDQSEPSSDERDRFWLERGVKALGICFPRNAADYSWMKLTGARPLIASLIRSGSLIEVQAETLQGVQTLLVHLASMDLLEKAASGEIKARRTTFLNPFDNLWWAQGRDEAFWGFRQRLEAYYPATKRIYGYYCLPILLNDQLIGRFDPKLERKTGLLRIKGLYLEPLIEPGEELVAAVADTLRDFMKFHQAKELLVEKSSPASFGEKLMQKVSLS